MLSKHVIELLDATGQRTIATSSNASTSARVVVGGDLLSLSFASSVRDLTSTGATVAPSSRGAATGTTPVVSAAMTAAQLLVAPPNVDPKLPTVRFQSTLPCLYSPISHSQLVNRR